MSMLIIKNGVVCLDEGLRKADLAVENRVISLIGEALPSSDADEIIDAGGKFVLPGLIDIHTHLDDVIGGYPLADGYRSGTEAAVRNGITAIATFITQSGQERLGEAIGRARSKAERNCFTDYFWHLTPTRFDEQGWGDIVTAVDSGFRSIKLYTTYKHAGIYASYDDIVSLFRRLAGRGVRFLIHCEDEAVLQGIPSDLYPLREPFTHTLLRPPEAEIVAIERLIGIARAENARIHIVHVSTPEGVELIAAARGSQSITCETCPQYIVHSEDVLTRPGGHRWLCSPPLRDEGRRRKLAVYAGEGSIDLFATDHCAFTRADKDRPVSDIRLIPNGVAGIGALSHIVFDLFRPRGDQAFRAMARHCSAAPAELLGVFPRKGSLRPGADADIAVVDPQGGKRPVWSSISNVHETYPDRHSTLSFEHVFLGGREVVRKNELIPGTEPKGKWLCPG